MQNKSLRIKPYKSWAVSDSASEVAISCLKKLELVIKLRSGAVPWLLPWKQSVAPKPSITAGASVTNSKGLLVWKDVRASRNECAKHNGQSNRNNKFCTYVGVTPMGQA